jgi:hypothetical protein
MKKSYYDQDFLKKVGINNLILFSLYSLSEKKEKCTFERLVKECFYLFPKIFSFSTISKWPDARKLDRPLRTLRRKKLIEGSPKNTFSLTKTGREAAESIVKIFGQKRLEI